MTVYDFMEKMGEYEEFYICSGGNDVTKGDPVRLHDVKRGRETREPVLNALGGHLIRVDATEWILYCE